MRVTPEWLWGSRSLSARMARFVLLPPSVLYRIGSAVRTRAYQFHILDRHAASVPVVAVGNLTVGGSGKTPVTSWIAGFYAERGLRPGVVLRGYGGGDEGRVHRRLVPEAIVVENPDRLAGVNQAAASGADIVILDDAFQRLDIGRDLNIALVSTESTRAARWTLPAGPWREGLRALRRADFLVVTRKRADSASAARVAERLGRVARGCPTAIVHLGIKDFRTLLGGESVPASALSGRRVLAAAGVADPGTFAAQCRALGADVRSYPVGDHHPFSPDDVRKMLHVGRRVDYVVVTEKDAAKLETLWPAGAHEPLVASLDVMWEQGQDDLERALETVVVPVDDLGQ
jgi:tetraacyldisaccharide 4'-kinase